MDWVEGFDAALLAFLQRFRPDAVSISWWEDTASTTGCDTCASTETVIEFVYLTADGSRGHYDHYGTFREVVRALTEVPASV